MTEDRAGLLVSPASVNLICYVSSGAQLIPLRVCCLSKLEEKDMEKKIS